MWQAARQAGLRCEDICSTVLVDASSREVVAMLREGGVDKWLRAQSLEGLHLASKSRVTFPVEKAGARGGDLGQAREGQR